MSVRLVPLDCPSCGSALSGARHDILYVCQHCGAGATLEAEGLEPTATCGLLPAPGRRAEVWLPAWMIEAQVAVDQRIRADGVRTEGWAGARVFIIPCFELGLNDLDRLARALSRAAGAVTETPKEAVHGGTLSLIDARALVRYLVVGEEIRKPDTISAVRVEIDETAHRLAALPFERAGHHLRCAVTGTTIRAPEVTG